MKKYDINRVTRGYRQIWDREENKKAWGKWNEDMMGTDMVKEFAANNQNYNVDWKEWLQGYEW